MTTVSQLLLFVCVLQGRWYSAKVQTVTDAFPISFNAATAAVAATTSGTHCTCTIQAYINVLPRTRIGVRVGPHARSNRVHVHNGTHRLSCTALPAAHAILLMLCWCCSVAPDPMFVCAIGYA
jgi:hypothetical protein